MLCVLQFSKSVQWTRSTVSRFRCISSMAIVKSAQGKLRGQIIDDPDAGNYYSFKGISYARPPVGKLRFMAPLSPQAWEGIRDATEHGGVCPQFDITTGRTVNGNEDCLYLNVYSKNLTPSRPAPVLFWLHGGSYKYGSGNSDVYGPEYLLRHNVVLVTVNYRLEALGFLCLDNEEVPGNAGLKDQHAALRWVCENISQFGGDPNNITLMGESAGGSSVNFHMVSPMSRGLFHKAITQSGAATCEWAYSTIGRERAFRLGKLLGKETNDPKMLLEFLQSVPAMMLTNTKPTLTPDEKIRRMPVHFCPVVEKRFPNVKPFISENILNYLIKDRIMHIPILTGYNTCEGMPALPQSLKKKDFINKNFYCKVPGEIYNAVPRSKSEEFGERIKQFYFQGADISDTNVKELCNLDSDLIVIYNCWRFADMYSKLNKNPLYMYSFSCDSDINLSKHNFGFPDIKGACHTDDIYYLFKNVLLADIVNKDSKIKLMIYRMTKMWTDFAKTGNPTPDDNLGIQWLPYDANKKTILLIQDELKLGQPDLRAMDFWSKIYAEAGCAAPKSNL